MNNRRKAVFLRAAVILVAAVAAAIFLLPNADRSWKEQYQHEEVRESGNRAFLDEGIIEWNGARYRKKPAMTLILLAGIDKTERENEKLSRTSYRNGGQADFLLLFAIDHGEKKIHRLQIDRDTMTEVTVLGVYGNETGTRELQICLAHSFGAQPEDNAKYTVKAVRTLLNGEEIDGYYIVDYSAIPKLTDALDGIAVTIPEDMTSVNPEWYEGHIITLKGKDAETFVRTRKTVGDGTNAERMNRQALYMSSVITKLNETLTEDTAFADELVSTLHEIAVTNLSDQQLLEEIVKAYNYDVLPIDYLPGWYSLDEDGFVAFNPKEGSGTEWVMNHLYSVR